MAIKELVNEKEDSVFLCKYNVPMLILAKGTEKFELDFTNILSIEKLDDFEFNIRSILKVKLRMDTKHKLWVIKNKREITVKFALDKLGLDREAETIITGPEEVWNIEFSIYLNDDDESIDTKSMEQTEEMDTGTEYNSNDLEGEDYFTSQEAFDIYLFNPKILNASNKTFNKVFTSAPLQDIVGELLTETGHKKVLMSPIENDEVYQELLVPSNPAYKGLIYLDQYYGLYKFGASIFYDLNKLYIINTNGKVTAKEKDEWTETTFLIPVRDKATPGNGMVRKSEEKVFYIDIPEENVSPQKPSISKNAEMGSEAKVVITDDITIDTASADQSFMNQRNEYIRYTRKDDNKYTPSILQARMEENECVIYISGENLDINAFTLNKTYKLVFEEASKQREYGSFTYRIAYAYHFIMAESGQYMKSSHQIVLKKCSKQN